MSTTTVHTPDLYSQLIADFQWMAHSLPGDRSVQAIRKNALHRFEQLGFPTARNEEWKYTDVKNLLKQNFDFRTRPEDTHFRADEYTSFIVPDAEANVLVFVNGVYQSSLSRIVSPASEVIISEFSQALTQHADLLADHFARYADFTRDSFTALNTAFAQQGVFIHVPANQTVHAPILLHYIADADEQNVAAMPRNLFVAGRNSQVHVAEIFRGRGTHTSFTNAVTEVVVSENARVNVYKVQDEHASAFTIHKTQVYQKRDSYFSSVTVTLDGTIVRNDLNVVLDDENGESHLYGLYLLTDKQHVDNHTLVDHAKPRSYSNELYKGILDGKSTGVFNGKIFVRKDAQKTNAFQSNRNILLSKEAAMNAKPQLEIFADDVKCSHGATTGQLDNDMLFYLRARGISLAKAKALLMHAFAADVVEHIAVASVKEYVQSAISRQLPT